MLTPDPRAFQEALRAYGETLYGTDEENRRERERQLKVLTDWHAHLLEAARDPILRALIEAHGPQLDDFRPACAECSDVPNNYGDADPQSWPCPVWRFISDRMGGSGC